MEKNNYQGALQQPIGSRFNATSTATEVIQGIDLHRKIAIVTGGHAGIGLETTKVLAAAGATVIVPGLIHFMQRNFMFNMSMERLGYLTGRSLSTFNRDFKKLFNTTPQKWLTQKRLELAYYHLAEKKRKPTEVYLEVGFEDLSHFSFIFKKKYGLSPHQVLKATS